MSDRSDAYAAALFEVAKAEGSLDTVEDELFKVARTLEANEDLRATLSDAAIPVERRQQIIESLLGGKASPITTTLVSFVVGAGRSKNLPEIIDKLVARAAQERHEAVAEVRTAYPIDEERRERLAEVLGSATGKHVTVKVVIDPSVLGGVVARVGDTVIDGTIRHRLEQLRESL
ncbi:MAG TPA: ATP synthase F1 subunit delta [Acidimicrobiales bacterium]|nr:ATP synthase F1 subunit delta [Acidimicrobiales bacterium]